METSGNVQIMIENSENGSEIPFQLRISYVKMVCGHFFYHVQNCKMKYYCMSAAPDFTLEKCNISLCLHRGFVMVAYLIKTSDEKRILIDPLN